MWVDLPHTFCAQLHSERQSLMDHTPAIAPVDLLEAKLGTSPLSVITANGKHCCEMAHDPLEPYIIQLLNHATYQRLCLVWLSILQQAHSPSTRLCTIKPTENRSHSSPRPQVYRKHLYCHSNRLITACIHGIRSGTFHRVDDIEKGMLGTR